ncbi:MAG: HD domain-containing protein [Pseudomonadota bacterium]
MDELPLNTRIAGQLDFLLTVDALKRVERKNLLHSGSRRENTAEHSWHLTLMAGVFAEYAPPSVDMARVHHLLAVHDLVEIYAGDHWELGSDAADVAAKEAQAAGRLFAKLPKDQAAPFRALSDEFTARQTPEAKFAKALDALHPMLLVWGPGGTGQTHTPLTAQQMRDLKRPYLSQYPQLWALAETLLDAAVASGTLPES